MRRSNISIRTRSRCTHRHRRRSSSSISDSSSSSIGYKIDGNDYSNRFALPSLGFSGAGFLGAYHAGVAACLLKHNYLLQPMEKRITDGGNGTSTGSGGAAATAVTSKNPPILTGVSAGAIISAAISTGVKIDDAMDVLFEINHRTKMKSHSMLHSFTPGFSLVDQVEDLIMDAFRVALGGSKRGGKGGGSGGDMDDYDIDLLMNRIDGGRLLRIGLTDRRSILRSIGSNDDKNSRSTPSSLKEESSPSSFITTREFLVKGNLNMYVYTSKYRNLKDIVSTAILSSYIPIGTGPLRANEPNTNNTAVKDSFQTVQEMEELGYIRHGVTGEIVNQTMYGSSSHDDDGDDDTTTSFFSRESYFWDGGLVNMFPTIDESTVMVTPLNCQFSNPYIAPDAITDNNHYINIDKNVSLGMNMQNLQLFRKMLKSSDPEYLDEKFKDGYDDTQKFLKEKGLLRVFH